MRKEKIVKSLEDIAQARQAEIESMQRKIALKEKMEKDKNE